MKMRTLLFLGFLGFGSIAESKSIALADVAETLAKEMPAGSIATAEVVGGEPVYALAGKAEPGGIAPEKVIFEIGSITKVFTGLLLAQAVMEQRVSLDTTVRELTGNKLKFANANVGAITLRQLATHTSGLPRLPDDLQVGANVSDPYIHYDRAKLDAYLVTVRLETADRESSNYSNLGVGLLGDLLARRYEKTWDQLIREKITGPLMMRDTVVELSQEQETRFAPPYDRETKKMPWHFTALAAAGALRSTLADMVLFGNALMNPPETPLGEAMKLMMQSHGPDGIGLCIGSGKIDGQRVLSHEGGTGGYRSSLQVLPEQKIVRVILINNAALDAAVVTSLARGEKPRTENSARKLSLDELAQFAGVYQLEKTARLTVLLHEEQLRVQLTGQPFFPIFPHEQADRFFLKEVAAELTFARENDRIVSVTLHQNGRDMTARRVEASLPKITFHKTAELRDYEGNYEGEAGLKFTALVQSDTLFVKLKGQSFHPVFERRPNWWMYDVVDAAISFERDTQGRVKALILHQNGQNQRALKK